MGVIGYLFVIRKGYGNISYIPATFIKSINSVCKNDVIKYLIDNDYISLLPAKTKQQQYYIATGLTKPEKKDPYLYQVYPKLIKLNSLYLNSKRLTKWIDIHLHLLNVQNFNHYNHSYKHIKINLPSNAQLLYEMDLIKICRAFGDRDRKEYFINEFGYDNNKWVGEHLNVFTFHRDLLKYTSLKKPIEIGLMDSKPTLLADQLLKTVGKNDFTDYYAKSRFKCSLFKFITDYYLFVDFDRIKFYVATFGYDYIPEFKKRFPKAFKLLREIKSGASNIQPYFKGFASNIKPRILKTDRRLQIPKTHRAHSQYLSNYRIISLVVMLREIKIMREIWRRLKKCDIIFIPLESTVVVAKKNAEVCKYIVNDVLKKHIDPRLYYITTYYPIK